MMGFGFMFKLDETCIENHLNERRVRTVEDTESVGVSSRWLAILFTCMYLYSTLSVPLVYCYPLLVVIFVNLVSRPISTRRFPLLEISIVERRLTFLLRFHSQEICCTTSVLGLLLSIDRNLTVAWEWFLTGWTNPAPNARPVMSKRKAPVTIHTRFSRACSLFDVRLVLQYAAETAVACNVEITSFIPLHEKFLQLDWLRVVVFQLNLKYLHVKITNLLRVVV